MSIKLIEALGAKDEDDALEIVSRVTALTAGAQVAASIVSQLEEVTGQASNQALAVVQAWKASHDALPAALSELEAVKAENAKREADAAQSAVQARLDGLVKAGLDSCKLSVALEPWARTQTPESLEAYLAVAHAALPQNVGEPARTGVAGLTADEIEAAHLAGLTPDEFARAKAARLQVATSDEE